eukprot:SAG22_NODE_208_length_15237_cov_22.602774_4_plen_111_part_00
MLVLLRDRSSFVICFVKSLRPNKKNLRKKRAKKLTIDFTKNGPYSFNFLDSSELLNFFGGFVYFNQAVSILVAVVAGHASTFSAVRMLVLTIPKCMISSLAVAGDPELSW